MSIPSSASTSRTIERSGTDGSSSSRSSAELVARQWRTSNSDPTTLMPRYGFRSSSRLCSRSTSSTAARSWVTVFFDT